MPVFCRKNVCNKCIIDRKNRVKKSFVTACFPALLVADCNKCFLIVYFFHFCWLLIYSMDWRVSVADCLPRYLLLVSDCCVSSLLSLDIVGCCLAACRVSIVGYRLLSVGIGNGDTNWTSVPHCGDRSLFSILTCSFPVNHLFPFPLAAAKLIGDVWMNRRSGVKMFLSVITAPLVLVQLIYFLIRRCYVKPPMFEYSSCKFDPPCLFKI